MAPAPRAETGIQIDDDKIELASKTFYASILEQIRSKELSIAAGAKVIASLKRSFTSSVATQSQERISKTAAEALSQLVPPAQESHNEELLLSLADQGASMASVADHMKRKLAKRAAESFNDAACAQIVRGGLKLDDPHGRALLTYAVSNGLIETVRTMLERGAPVDSRDETGNSILHIAFAIGNITMVRLILPHVDPLIKNTAGQTPLETLIHAYEKDKPPVQIREQHYPAFFQALLERPQDRYQGTFDRTPQWQERLAHLGKPFFADVLADIVEITYLFNDNALNNALFAGINQKDFHRSCQELELKYPHGHVAQFASSYLSLDPRQYATGKEQFAIPTVPPPGNPPIEQLRALFEHLKELDYVDFLKTVRDGPVPAISQEQAKALIVADLDVLIQRIAKREHFFGVPRAGSQGCTEYFTALEIMLKHIIASLVQSPNSEATREALRQIIGASTHCGGRYYTAILHEYMAVCCHKAADTPEEAIFKVIAEFRLMCFETAIANIPNHDVHDSLDARANLGAKFGIPGHQQAIVAHDPYSRLHTHDAFVEKTFLEHYQPTNIIQELLSNMEKNGALREQYLDLQKSLGAHLWKPEVYQSILEKLPVVEACEDAELKEALSMSILGPHEIMVGPNQSLQEAVREDQVSGYLEHQVYNEEGKLRPEAVEFLLCKLHVLQSPFDHLATGPVVQNQ